MKRLISTIVMFAVLGLSMTVNAQTPAPKTEIELLQEQMAALIKSRGEDQRTIAELKTQLSTVAQRVPVQEQGDLTKKNLDGLKAICEVVGLKLTSVVIKRGTPQPSIETQTCSVR